MKRLVLAVAALAALSLSAAPAQAAFKTGVSDQTPGAFEHPLFAPLKFTTARYITPWDVMSLPADNANRVALDLWITNARATGQDILISFEHSHTPGQEKKAPKASTFRSAVIDFLRAYPTIRNVSPWNEVNRCNRTLEGGLVIGQPRKLCRTSSGPPRAAAYYRNTLSACRAVRRRCRVVALDILDQADVSSAVRYVKRFRRFAKPRPKIWGIHNYSDSNRFSTKRTRALLRATRRGQVWLTEAGGIVKLGSSFPFNERRAARAIGCTFRIAKKFKRIKRVFIYNFSAGAENSEFESGLVRADGTRRPGYNVVRRRKAGRC
jgi:hypothetical protein